MLGRWSFDKGAMVIGGVVRVGLWAVMAELKMYHVVEEGCYLI